MPEQIDTSLPFLTAPQAAPGLLDAVRRRVPSWDGRNMQVVVSLLRVLNFSDAQIRKMSMFDATMELNVREQTLKIACGSSADTSPRMSVDTLHADEAPEWPQDDKLHWRPFEVAHCGKVCKQLTPKQFDLLKAVFESQKSLSFESLKETVWRGKEISDGNIRTTLSTAKTALREAGLDILAEALSTPADHAVLDQALLLRPC